jgi:hypothetical protein
MKYGVFLLVFPILFSLTGCMSDLKAPEWDVNFALPLLNDTYPVSDLTDGTSLILDDNDVLTYQVNGTMLGSPGSNFLSMNPIDTGFLEIPSNFEGAGTMPLDGSVLNELGQVSTTRASYAVIGNCALHFEVQKVSDLQSIVVTFPDIYLPGSSDDNLVVLLNQGNTGNFQNEFSVDLQGYRIGQVGNTSLYDTIPFSIVSTSNESGIADQIRVHFDEPMTFSYMVGEFDKKIIPVEDSEAIVDVDYPDHLSDAVQLRDAVMTLNVHNEFGFPMALTGYLVAYGANGETRRINLLDEHSTNRHLIIQPNTEAVNQEIEFSDSVSYLLNCAPTRVDVVSSHFLIVPANYNQTGSTTVTGSVYSTDDVHANYLASVPCRVLLNHTTLTPAQVDSVDITDDNRKYVRENANSGSLDITLDNSLAVGGVISLYFATVADTTILYTSDQSAYPDVKFVRYLDQFRIEPETSDQHFTIEMTPEDVQFFDSPEIFIGFRFEIDSTESQYVAIYGNNSIHLQAHLSLNAHIEGDN